MFSAFELNVRESMLTKNSCVQVSKTIKDSKETFKVTQTFKIAKASQIKVTKALQEKPITSQAFSPQEVTISKEAKAQVFITKTQISYSTQEKISTQKVRILVYKQSKSPIKC